MKTIKLTILAWLITCALQGFSIPKITINAATVQNHQGLWDMQIISDFAEAQIVTVRLMLYDPENKLLYNGVTEEFLLQPGVYSLDMSQINAIHTDYITDALFSGNMELTAKVYLVDPVNNIEIYQTSENVFIQQTIGTETSRDNNQILKRDKFNKYFALHGTAELTGSYNTRNDTLFYLPFDYFRFRLNTSVDLFEIPFKFDMYVTTEQKYTSQRLNSYSFNFDYQTFQNRLFKKASEKLKSVSDNTVINQVLEQAGNYKSYSPEEVLAELKKQNILSPEILKKYTEFTQLDSLKKLFDLRDNIQLKKYSGQLLEEMRSMGTERLDSLKIFYSNYSETQLFDSLIYLSDSLPGIIDTIRDKIYALMLLKDSLYAQYSKITGLLENRNIGDIQQLQGLLGKIDKYSLDDLKKLEGIQYMVQDKVDEFNYQERLNEIKKIKNLKISDWKKISGNPAFQSVLNKYGIINKKEQILSGVRDLGLGTVYPFYTEYSINGIILNGYNIAWCYKNLYIGSTGGKQLNIYTDSISQGYSVDKNNLFGFVTGFGDKARSHFHVYYLYGKRNLTNIDADTLPVSLVNHVVTPEFKIDLFKGRVRVTGEFPISFLNKEQNRTPNPLTTQKSIGYAARALVNYQVAKNTTLTSGMNYISHNYTSFGLPFYTRDRLQAETKMVQKVKDWMQITVGYEYENYKLFNDDSLITTQIHSGTAGIRVQYKILKWSLTYKPSFIQTFIYDKNTSFISNFSGVFGVNYRIRESKNNIQLGGNYAVFFQNQVELTDNGSIVLRNDFDERNVNLNIYLINNILFGKFALTQNFTYNKNKMVDTSNVNIIIFNLGIRQTINEKVRYAFSLQYANTLGQNTKTGIQTVWDFDIWKYLSIQLKLRHDYIKGLFRENQYNTHGFLVSAGLRIKI